MFPDRSWFVEEEGICIQFRYCRRLKKTKPVADKP